MRVLVLVHRWLGVVFCLPVAMWFATGIVMHFVPFPALQDARVAGEALDLARVQHGPGEAVAASGIDQAMRVKLIARSDGPIYLISSEAGTKAIRAEDLADATVRSFETAVAIAVDDARRRENSSRAAITSIVPYDQWTLSSGYDRRRPLYRIAFDDDDATEVYVSSTSGEVVLTTTGRARAWNYAGAILHWIYVTPLRSHPAVLSALLWWLSLLALIGVTAGVVLGPCRLTFEGGRLASPFRGWQAWHHWLGLACMPFIVTFMFSGWLSMDDGLLFSSGKPSAAEIAALQGAADWRALPADEIRRVRAPVSEVSWFAFAGRIYRRERETSGRQRLFAAGSESSADNRRQEFLTAEEIDAAARHLTARCEPAVPVASDDSYAPAATRDGPVFRLVCGSDWFHIAADNGALLEKLDASRRRYRWLSDGLHKLDFPILRDRPALRTALIVLLCACGLMFSMTALVIAWRKTLSLFRAG